jgi:hypothetical protein
VNANGRPLRLVATVLAVFLLLLDLVIFAVVALIAVGIVGTIWRHTPNDQRLIGVIIDMVVIIAAAVLEVAIAQDIAARVRHWRRDRRDRRD